MTSVSKLAYVVNPPVISRTCGGCLRLWLLRFDSAGNVVLSRPLAAAERLAAQGFLADLGRGLDERTVARMAGNVTQPQTAVVLI